MSAHLPASLRSVLERELGVSVDDSVQVGGGCISQATRIETDGGSYFVKWGSGHVARTFEVEAAGLRRLDGADTGLHIPDVLAVDAGSGDRPGFLLMEWIETGEKSGSFWADLGRHLADLHRSEGAEYGFEVDNYIGRLPQVNDPCSSWPEFFAERRLQMQIQMAKEKGRWNDRWDQYSGRLLDRIDGWLPEDPTPSILHGDLWSGNVMADRDGRGVLIDPAVYFGHREAELAFTELFGGFEPSFYGAYREAWPMEPGYEQRRDIYNLYHLINHLNHFGAGYADSVESLLRRYG